MNALAPALVTQERRKDLMGDWPGKRVVIVGAARQGLALARYLARHGARITVNDRRSADELASALTALGDLDVLWELGGHPLRLLDAADILAISGGVPLDNPLVVEASRRGLPLTNDTQIFMEAVPCKTVGITGSAGKTTTTTLVGRIAQSDASGRYHRAWVGGNIGDPLINYVDEMSPDDIAILEISSFQLEEMTRSPNVAAILNLTPNHLDRHGNMGAYRAAKARILEFQTGGDLAVLGRDDPGAWGLADRVHGALLSFGFSPLSSGQEGAFERGGQFVMSAGGREVVLPVADVIELRGEHNRLNRLRCRSSSSGHARGCARFPRGAPPPGVCP
jgi:UDP-N-acetylmuramoylalanine--D-glutamate ligase